MKKSIPPNEKVYPLMQKSIPPLNYGTNIAPYNTALQLDNQLATVCRIA